jgi:hypothetical protein
VQLVRNLRPGGTVLRVTATLLATIALIVALMALPCLPSKGDEPLPPANVLYLPLVCRNSLAERDKPELISPKDGSQLATLAPEFEWHSTEQHWFCVEISTDPQFLTVEVPVPARTHGTGPDYKMSLLTNLQMATLYHWRVGYDDDTGFFTWSQVGWFTTPGPGRPTPCAPLPALPADGSTVGCLSPYLEWQSVVEARMYHITLNVQGNMFTFSVLSPGAGEVIPFSLLPGHTYAWHVRAFNGFAWGPESPTWLFRTPSD